MSFRHLVALTAALAAGCALAQAPPQDANASKPNPSNASAPNPGAPKAPSAETSVPVSAPKPNAPTAPTPPNTTAAPAVAPPQHLIVTGDAKAGAGKAAVCGACHGIDGNPTDKQYPKLAGQNEAYIARQLDLFKTQKRQNPIMLGMAAALTPQDMHDVGAYFASKASLPGVADEKLVERGQALYRGGDAKLGIPACMACHGPDGHGMAGTGFPQLGAQWTDYVAAKLKDWKNGTTWGDDAKAKIMPAIAKNLGDDDINALASYVDGLHSAQAASAAAAAP